VDKDFYSAQLPLLDAAIRQMNTEEIMYYILNTDNKNVKVSEVDYRIPFQYDGSDTYLLEYFETVTMTDIPDKRSARRDIGFIFYKKEEYIFSAKIVLVDDTVMQLFLCKPEGNTLTIYRKKTGEAVQRKEFDLGDAFFCASTNMYPALVREKGSFNLLTIDYDLLKLNKGRVVDKGEYLEVDFSSWQNGVWEYYYDENNILTRQYEPDFGLDFLKVDSFDDIKLARTYTNLIDYTFFASQVPSNRYLPNISELQELIIRIHYKNLSRNWDIRKDLTGAEILDADYTNNVITMRLAESIHPRVGTDDNFPETEENYRISALAKEIVGSEKDTRKMVALILERIVKNIEYDPLYRERSAVETLNDKRGDCTEFSLLFSSLAASLGIQTKQVYGYLPQFSSFGGHAWNIVAMDGRWYGVEPTAGTFTSGLHYVMSPFQYTPQIDYFEIVRGKYKDGTLLATRDTPLPAVFVCNFNDSSILSIPAIPGMMNFKLPKQYIFLDLGKMLAGEPYFVNHSDYINPTGIMLYDFGGDSPLEHTSLLQIQEDQFSTENLGEATKLDTITPFFPDTIIEEYKQLGNGVFAVAARGKQESTPVYFYGFNISSYGVVLNQINQNNARTLYEAGMMPPVIDYLIKGYNQIYFTEDSFSAILESLDEVQQALNNIGKQ